MTFSIDNPEGGIATTPLRKICLGKPSGEQGLNLVLLITKGVVTTPSSFFSCVPKTKMKVTYGNYCTLIVIDCTLSYSTALFLASYCHHLQ